MHKNYFGSGRSVLLEWLGSTWKNSGPTVCFLEGFPGVGKSDLVAELSTNFENASDWVVVNYEVPDRRSVQLMDVWLEIGERLSAKGLPRMQEVMLSEATPNPAFALETALRKNVCIVLDEAQRLFEEDSGRPSEQLSGILSFLKQRPALQGRLLLLSDRLVERERWSESFAIKTLNSLTPDEAESLLDDRLGVSLIDDVPSERKGDLLRVLGHNPRAIETLVATLHYEPLEEILGGEPGLWEVQDREVSPEFLAKLERQLLERTLTHLDEVHVQRLTMLAVHRGSFEVAAFETACSSNRKEWRDLRNLLITRFLVKHGKAFYSLHPVVREISLARLKANFIHLVLAHSRAADYYMRHFQAQTIVIKGRRLALSYAELRYHLFQSSRLAELKDVTIRVADHIAREFGFNSPIPEDADELDERISLLTVLLEFEQSFSLEYYLARLFVARGNATDAQSALTYAERAMVRARMPEFWVFLARLRETIVGVESAIRTVLDALNSVDKSQNRNVLYQLGAELLQKSGEVAEAIKLLRDGILVVAPHNGLSALYLKAANLIAEHKNADEAVALLSEGVRIVPPEKDLSSLYYKICELLFTLGERSKAFALLDEGFDRIPPDKGLSALYQLRAELLQSCGDVGLALQTLMAGIDRIPPEKGVDLLYTQAAAALDGLGRTADAMELLKRGIGELGARHGGDGLKKILKNFEGLNLLDENLPVAEADNFALKKITVLVMATEWFSKHGGLSTFNRTLCRELAKHDSNVICAVPKASPEEILAAAQDGVTLFQGPPGQGADPLNGLYRRLQIHGAPDVVIGHGRITGSAARVQTEDNYPKALRVHFVHMAPGEIEWFKGKADAALVSEAREREELDLTTGAAIVAAVGPRLYREVGNLIEARPVKPDLIEFIPGCTAPAQPRVCPPQLHCLLLGRAEDMELKGLDIAARALVLASERSKALFEHAPELVVRGAPANTGAELRSRLKQLCGGELPIRVREYSSSENDIEGDLRRASLLLMPSRREGFGLVALEALAIGTPILVSDQSGIGDLIKSLVKAPEASRVVVPTVESVSVSAEAWARAIEFQLADRSASFERAWDLAKRVEEEDGWGKSVKNLLEVLVSKRSAVR